GSRGYGGPVAHWWRDSLLFCGPAADWRYEGIVAGYLTLHGRTGHQVWLDRAQRCGDELVAAQQADGSYRWSSFERNPASHGTPHEAAVDIALLLLARRLRDIADSSWRRYVDAAHSNVRQFYLSRLWNEGEQQFRDDARRASFVPNKTATLIEALSLLSELDGSDDFLRYVKFSADGIMALQIADSGSELDGAIAQNSLDGQVVPAYFPYYNARCVPGLLEAGRLLNDERYVHAAKQAVAFVFRFQDSDGAFPQVLYRNGRGNRFPRWIAATGDVLRAAELLRPLGLDVDTSPTRQWLLAGQLENGAFATAQGFRSQVSQHPHQGLPDVRDLLGVCGWNDKAFRYLASEAQDLSEIPPDPLSRRCLYLGREANLREDADHIEIVAAGGRGLHWRKGDEWAREIEA
ncbi:MAG: hypothetical protein JOZ39_08550, partial [Chloroflexi bacterium]|nr:hypothetical protein [Chloroflexota bacterium]